MIACTNCKVTRREFDRMVIECIPLVNHGRYHYVCCEFYPEDYRVRTQQALADLDTLRDAGLEVL